ncbi:MAG: hypothetical protein J5I94_21920 [Phaeodactylibacter sp.]|nr:hypothetical protein [Phaeodactylibacter sp.]
MTMILEELLSAILQIFAFTLIPFLVYIIRRRSVKGFFQYIGLKPASEPNFQPVFSGLHFLFPGSWGLCYGLHQ